MIEVCVHAAGVSSPSSEEVVKQAFRYPMTQDVTAWMMKGQVGFILVICVVRLWVLH